MTIDKEKRKEISWGFHPVVGYNTEFPQNSEKASTDELARLNKIDTKKFSRTWGQITWDFTIWQICVGVLLAQIYADGILLTYVDNHNQLYGQLISQ